MQIELQANENGVGPIDGTRHKLCVPDALTPAPRAFDGASALGPAYFENSSYCGPMLGYDSDGVVSIVTLPNGPI